MFSFKTKTAGQRTYFKRFVARQIFRTDAKYGSFT